MTEPEAETQEPVEDADSAPELEDTLEQHDPAEAVKKARADAAGYRRRLRDTEAERNTIAAERDALRSRLDDRQRADVETLAGQRLQHGSDLWATDVDLASLLDDDGAIDEFKVSVAVDQLITSKPHYARPRPQFDLGHRGGTAETGPSFADVLRGGTRHGS